MTTAHDVVVTGLGATTPLGGDVPSTWSAALAGESGARTFDNDWAERFSIPVGFAATLKVPFAREEIVGVTAWRHERLANDRLGYDTVTVAANHFTQGDVGKRIVIKGACGGGTDCVGVIKSITDATHVVMQFKSGNVNGNGFAITNTAADATIGENEPDALYLPVVSCNAQETISWSNLSATGLTLTSSNPASKATCVVLLVR